MNEPKPLEERKAILSKHVASAVASGARIESQSDTMAVLVTGKRVNHILHFLLGFVTFFMWWLVWLYFGITGGEKRRVVTVDEYGTSWIKDKAAAVGVRPAAAVGRAAL